MIDIDQLHGEIWYQVAYTMALLEGDKQKSKEVYKELSDKIHEILVSRVELPSSVAEPKSKSEKFFISYFYSLKNKAQGFGNCEIFINEFDKDIIEQKILSENQDWEKIIIINFERL